MADSECTALLKTANRLYRMGDARRARILLEIMSEVYPENAHVWATLATLTNDDAQKTEYLARAAQFQPTFRPLS